MNRIGLLGAAPAEGLAEALGAEGFALHHQPWGASVAELVAWGAQQELVLVQPPCPGGNVTELCRRLRAAGYRQPLLVIVNEPGSNKTVNNDGEAERVALLEAGADDVLPASCGLPELVARCRALLRRHSLQGPPAPTVLRLGGLELVEEECRVSRDGEPVQLSHREFQLLLFLMRHPGRPWSRSELMEQVWGPYSSYEIDQKTVDVHIRWLRIKLEKDPANPRLIRTVRGRGYELSN